MTEKSNYLHGEPTWLDLASPDTDASAAFYGALFGWAATEGRAEFGGYRNVVLEDKTVAGLVPLMAEGQPPVWTTYIRVDDSDATHAVIAANGGTVIAPPMDVDVLGRMALYTDPSGAAFGTWQAGQHTGAQLVHQEGTFAWAELSTRDQAAVQPFYAAVFGWQAAVQPGYTEFQLGEVSVAGCLDMPAAVPAEVPSYWMPYFAAADPQAQANRAAELGGTIVMPVQEFPGGRFAVVRDPHGATFGLLALRQ